MKLLLCLVFVGVLANVYATSSTSKTLTVPLVSGSSEQSILTSSNPVVSYVYSQPMVDYTLTDYLGVDYGGHRQIHRPIHGGNNGYYPNQGYPNQGYPNQGYPVYPNDGYPNNNGYYPNRPNRPYPDSGSDTTVIVVPGGNNHHGGGGNRPIVVVPNQYYSYV